ncbi:unnamed protein product [Cyclocybe aegerita]|uniref:Uncharacterized protein n=1 Tax=Cyclocybe aegerita TaxID=1973307 RepID=A0A8S0XZQ2_CYCAE|nr:unnamed protein product [Cyclocybe aegerita]
MPALPSFITSRKGKVAFKSPFTLLRGEQSTPASVQVAVPAVPPHPLADEVLVINDRNARHYSLDFDGGQPIDEYETDIIDEELRNPRPNNAPTPQVQLDIDLSPEGLTDWFAANFLQPENAQPSSEKAQQGQTSGSGLRNEAKPLGSLGSTETLSSRSRSALGEADEGGFSTSSEDVLSNLKAMNASHFGKMHGSEFNRSDQASSSSNKPSATLLAIPAGSSQSTNSQESRPEALSDLKPLRPMSLLDTPASSAVSGTNFARALLSNAFVLPNDNRLSRFRTSTVGLTRSDSTTLPRGDHAGPSSYHDRFSVGPDAPPVPSNAGFLYEPPKKSRAALEWREKKRQELKRRSSTGSLHPKILPETPSYDRPISALLSPGAEFDLNDLNSLLLKSPALVQTPPPPPRSPLPPTPQPKRVEESKTVELTPTPAARPLPIGPQTPSSDFLSLLSPAPSSDGLPSGKNLESDDVLNYYSHPDSPEPLMTGGYRPGVSPISEETSSQLSPPTPYRDRRESQRSTGTPLGARSPLSGSIRVRGDSVPLPRKLSDSRPYSRQLLAPMGERPLSSIQPPSPSGSQTSSLASAGSDLLAPLAPPPSHIFSRQRSGSAPSPIKVIRDPKDAITYNITVSPSNADSDTPTSDEGIVTQDFPETPSAFSPLLTGGTDAPPSLHQSLDGHDVPPMATIPTSATISRGTQPSLAQQLLLNRAGTTGRQHTKQTSVGKIKTSGLAARSGSPTSRRIADIIEDVETEASPADQNGGIASRRMSAAGSQPESPSNQVLAHEMSRSPSRGTVITTSDASSMYTSDSSSKPRIKSLPPIPNSPIPSTRAVSPATTIESPVNAPESSTAIVGAPAPPTAPSIPPPSPTLAPKPPAPSPARGRLPPALNISSSNPVAERAVAVNGNATDSSDSPASSSRPASNPPVFAAASSASAPAPSAVDHDQAPGTQSSSSHKYEDAFTGRASDIFRATSLGSPPPYYTVVNETPLPQVQQRTPPSHPSHTPNGSFSHNASFSFSEPNFGTPGPSNLEWSNNMDGRSTLGRENSIAGQRSRMRPPLPQGPRRPSQQQMMAAGGPSGQFHPSRDRSGSISSVASNALPHTSRVRSAPVFSPKFQTPPPKWRGYTMEAAKWTFTSAQLQAIVSRAIKQSAEASSIRLLRLDVLDTEIPEEMRRLEAQRTDLKTRYKVLTRRRATLLDALTAHMTGNEEDNSSYALRLLEEIREMVVTLDRLAEELHSLDGQLAHLESLTHIHTGSALAMALRKLNASFLKQVAENQVLRNQNQALEAERDEAWAQAEVVANEFDRMNDKIDSPSSKRSSRISAVRKSSVRVSKAGLRTPSQRLSQRSSLGSSLCGPTSSSKSPLPRLEKSPPVPPIPKRRPLQISTESPLRSSAVLSSGGVTPNSETRALAEAQDELYAMLGITNPDRRLRRSRSAAGLLLSPPPVTALLNVRPSDINPSRRSSLPGDSSLAEAYNAMAADRNAVLATIDMLSATD